MFAVDYMSDGKLSFTELYVPKGNTPKTKMMSPKVLKYAIETEKLYKILAYRGDGERWEKGDKDG